MTLSEHLQLELAAMRHQGQPLPVGAPVPGCACVRCMVSQAGGDELDVEDAVDAVHVLAGVHPEDRHTLAREMHEARIELAGWGWPRPAVLAWLAGEVPRAVRPGERIPGCVCDVCTSPPSRREHDRLVHRAAWDDEVERARAVPIGEVARRLGVEVNRRGWAVCPFHDDSSPSFHVNDEKGRAFCNPCGRSWDGIALVMELGRLEFTDAVKELAT